MIYENRLETKPIQHIRNLFDSIKDGKLSITRYDAIEPPCDVTYEVSCDAADADEFISKYEMLTQSLAAIGRAREALDSGVSIEELLTPDQIAVWNTYVCDFDEEFDAGEYDIGELYEMRECGADLSDAEQEVLERHYEWFEAQCFKRLPRKEYSPVTFVNRAWRYERLISINAPDVVVEEEARLLAEEMLLYYFARK